ncbi:MAG: hypothetical protein J0M15_05905 [Deltaproteobacteria bacterium]|nr:hypothetical protein [Deltaproteobacteria bacterium]
MSHKIGFATSQQQSQIESLRLQEYAQAKGYSVDLTTLKWKASDEDSFVMYAQIGETLVSTMRGEIINDQSLLEKKLECPLDFKAKLEWPVLLLSRAATLKSHQSIGMNLLLRYWFLKFADFHQIPLVLGTFVDGSPRQNTLLKMGYQFFENKLGWQQSTYRSHRPVIIAALNMKTHGVQAQDFCKAQLSTDAQQFNFKGNFPELRYVRNI